MVFLCLLTVNQVSEMVDNSVENALSFGNKIDVNVPIFELLAPVRLNTVCFTLNDYSESNVSAFLSALNETGKVFMSPTFYRGKEEFVLPSLIGERLQRIFLL